MKTEDDEARDLFGQSGSLSWGSAFPDLGDLQERGFQRAIELDGKIRLGDEISLGSVLEAQLEFRLGEGSLPGDEFRLDSVEDCYEDDELDEDFEGPGESDLPGESELDEGCEGPGERDLLGESELDDGCELDEYCELNEYFLDKDFEYGEDFNFDQNGLFDQKPRFIPKRWQGRYFKVPLENVRLDREMGFRRLGVFAPSDILEMRQQVRDLVAGKLREG
ncbi:MAG: hypothetical protein LBE49_06240 [Deltaproteobacteria bacterium]|nr:hypothetical protein [Deltaproteobacteria bacterium]